MVSQIITLLLGYWSRTHKTIFTVCFEVKELMDLPRVAIFRFVHLWQFCVSFTHILVGKLRFLLIGEDLIMSRIAMLYLAVSLQKL